MTEQQQTSLATHSTRFLAAVERQFTAEMGSALAFTDYEKTLAQHLFLRVDAQLKALEAKRGGDGTPYTWENVNMTKLALDAVHRVNLGLDALIPNHIHPIPYLNRRLGKYDLDLRVGYAGKDLCRRALAVEQPVDVIYQLVHETDEFRPIMRSISNKVEGYEFTITNPFARGKVIGGFGYIMYEDPTKNRLVLVTERDFAKAEAAAQTKDFWGDAKWRQEMMYKTVVHRTADKIPLDPRKVNAASYAYVEAQEAEAELEREVEQNANGKVIDVTFTPTPAEVDHGDKAGESAETAAPQEGPPEPERAQPRRPTQPAQPRRPTQPAQPRRPTQPTQPRRPAQPAQQTLDDDSPPYA